MLPITRALAPLQAAAPVDMGPTSDFWYEPVTAFNSSGVRITPETAMAISTVYACVRILSNAVGMLPLVVFERMANGGKTRAPNHPLYSLLHDQPNPRENAFQFKQRMTKSLLLRGNAFSRIVPGPRGFADQLMPLHPDFMRVELLQSGRRRYTYTPPGKSPEPLLEDEVLHLYTMSEDGTVGASLIRLAANSFGLAAATEQYGARLFSNGALHQGILSHPGELKPATRKALQDNFKESVGGLANAHNTLVLQEGMTWTNVSINPDDAQFLETRTFQSAEIAQWFGIPAEMLTIEGRATTWGTGIESLMLGFVTFTLTPWMVLWEQTINNDLILNPRRFFVEFIREALLRGDAASRAAFYRTMINTGVMTRNEVRQRENLNFIPGMDEPLIPLHLQSPAEREQRQERREEERERRRPPADSAATLTLHHRALLVDASARAIRKEVETVRKLAQKHAGDADGFEAAVDDFYLNGVYQDWLAATLKVAEVEVVAWCQAQAAEVTAQGGLGNIETWVLTKPRDLALLVAGEQA